MPGNRRVIKEHNVNTTLMGLPKIRSVAIVLVGTLVVGALVGGPRRATAQRTAPPTATPAPSGPLWCGLTADGGVVNFQLTADLRFVDWIEVRTPDGIISTREGIFTGVGDAQIVEKSFIFRQEKVEEECVSRDRERCTAPPCRPGSSGGRRPTDLPPDQCRSGPCRPGGSRGGRPTEEPRAREQCRTITTIDLNINGVFRAPTDAWGRYSATQVIDAEASAAVGRLIIKPRLVNGTFVAWPTGTAPCP